MTASVTSVALVVPCFNEAHRLDVATLVELAEATKCDVVVVDDGSTDGTSELLHSVAAHPRVRVISLPRNRGKGEAVRQGLITAFVTGHDYIGFCDADFATPIAEMERLVQACADGHAVVLGSRVALLGHDIERSAIRHYTGRVFGTLSSLVLGFQVYDTQCGAKIFRVGEPLRAALDRPFASRWAFDVELLGRLAQEHGGTGTFLEVPLRQWVDTGGSKLSFAASIKATLDLIRIRRALAARRRRVTPEG